MIRVASLFCGCGGSDMGLYRAAEALGVEVRVVAAIDSWEPAVRAYNANLPHPVARVADVKAMTRADLPPHDLIIGGPPCQDHSLAGARKCKCNSGGPIAERCCLADFVRLAGIGTADEVPYLMENVVPRLINASYSVKLCAKDFGDVTSRKRWFYSNYLLHVLETPGPRRIRDIRSRHDALKIGMRGHSASASASAFEDDSVLGSLIANSWHGNEASRLQGCRNPTLLEMQRAHSFPDEFDWCGATKTDRGKMIANSWPIGMAEAICRAMLSALIAERESAA